MFTKESVIPVMRHYSVVRKVNSLVRQAEPFGSQALAICPLVWGHLGLTPDRGKGYYIDIDKIMRGN